MPRPASDPPPASEADFNARLWELLARADRLMGMTRPERERIAETNADIRATHRKVPVIMAAIDGAMRRFEVAASLVSSKLRGLGRPDEARRESERDAQGPDARLTTIERKIRSLERLLFRLRRRVADAADGADEWERRAMLAVRAGDDVLAKDALGRRRACALVALSLAREVDTGVKVLAEMRKAAAEIRALHAEAERKAPREGQ